MVRVLSGCVCNVLLSRHNVAWRLYVVSDTLYVIYDIWHMICDIWYMTCDIWYVIRDMWHVIYDIWYVIRKMWDVICDTMWCMTRCEIWVGFLMIRFLLTTKPVQECLNTNDVCIQMSGYDHNLLCSVSSVGRAFGCYTPREFHIRTIAKRYRKVYGSTP